MQLMLIHNTGKVLFVKDTKKDYHCQYGYVRSGVLERIKISGRVKTNKGIELSAFTPSFIDLYARIRRAPQIIPRKDLAAIIAETGTNKDTLVIDAGSGSGSLAVFLGMIAKKVVSYEIRSDFAKIAADNVKFLGLKNVTIKNKDIYNGISEKNADVITLDLPEPWKAICAAEKALKVGGFIVSYSPTTPQVSDFTEACKKPELMHVKTIEIIQREWDFNERVIRPKSQPIGHSGFLTFIRKIK